MQEGSSPGPSGRGGSGQPLDSRGGQAVPGSSLRGIEHLGARERLLRALERDGRERGGGNGRREERMGNEGSGEERQVPLAAPNEVPSGRAEPQPVPPTNPTYTPPHRPAPLGYPRHLHSSRRGGMPTDIEGQIRFFINYFLHYPQRRVTMFIEYYRVMENNVTSFQQVLEAITGYHQGQSWHPSNLTINASVPHMESYQGFFAGPNEPNPMLIRRNNQEMIKWLKDLQAGYLRLQRAFAGGGPGGEAFCLWPTPLGLFVANMIATAVTQGYPSTPLERAVRIICAMIQPDEGTLSQPTAVLRNTGATQPSANKGGNTEELRRGSMYRSAVQSHPGPPSNPVRYCPPPASSGGSPYFPQGGVAQCAERNAVGGARVRDYPKPPLLPNPPSSLAETSHQSASTGISTSNQKPKATPSQTEANRPQDYFVPIPNYKVAQTPPIFPSYSHVVQGTAGLMPNPNREHSVLKQAKPVANALDQQEQRDRGSQGNRCDRERVLPQTNYSGNASSYRSPLTQAKLFGTNSTRVSGALEHAQSMPSTSKFFPKNAVDPNDHSTYYNAPNRSMSTTSHPVPQHHVIPQQSLPTGSTYWQNSGAVGCRPPPGIVKQDNQMVAARYSKQMMASYCPWSSTDTPQFCAEGRRTRASGTEEIEGLTLPGTGQANTQGARPRPPLLPLPTPPHPRMPARGNTS